MLSCAKNTTAAEKQAATVVRSGITYYLMVAPCRVEFLETNWSIMFPSMRLTHVTSQSATHVASLINIMTDHRCRSRDH